MSLVAPPGGTVRLHSVLSPPLTGKFPQAKVYDHTDSLVATVSLSDNGDGTYGQDYTTPGTPGRFNVVYTVYTDGTYTTRDDAFDLASERLSTETPGDIAEAVRDIPVAAAAAGSLGEAALVARNQRLFYRIDNFSYDPSSFLTTCRIRIFPDAATAAASTAGALGAEGALASATLTGVADTLFTTLPDDVLSS